MLPTVEDTKLGLVFTWAWQLPRPDSRIGFPCTGLLLCVEDEDDPAIVGLNLMNGGGQNDGKVALVRRHSFLREDVSIVGIFHTSEVCLQAFGEVLAWEANGQTHMCLLVRAPVKLVPLRNTKSKSISRRFGTTAAIFL